MKVNKFVIVSILSSFIFLSCQKSVEMNNFNYEQWKTEKIDCKDYRSTGASIIEKNSNSFIGINEGEVQKTLGRPDKIDLGAKHTKVLIYHINENTKKCPTNTSPYKFNTLRFELDPLGNVKFVTWQ